MRIVLCIMIKTDYTKAKRIAVVYIQVEINNFTGQYHVCDVDKSIVRVDLENTCSGRVAVIKHCEAAAETVVKAGGIIMHVKVIVEDDAVVIGFPIYFHTVRNKLGKHSANVIACRYGYVSKLLGCLLLTCACICNKVVGACRLGHFDTCYGYLATLKALGIHTDNNVTGSGSHLHIHTEYTCLCIYRVCAYTCIAVSNNGGITRHDAEGHSVICIVAYIAVSVLDISVYHYSVGAIRNRRNAHCVGRKCDTGGG